MRQGGELPQLQGGPAGHSCPHPHRRGRCGPPSRLTGSQALAQGGPSSSRQSDAGQPRKAAASLPEQVALRLRPPQRAAGPSQAQSAGGTGPAPRVGPVGSLDHGHCPRPPPPPVRSGSGSCHFSSRPECRFLQDATPPCPPFPVPSSSWLSHPQTSGAHCPARHVRSPPGTDLQTSPVPTQPLRPP